MFFDKNNDIIDNLRQVGYDPLLIGKAVDMVDDGLPDSMVENVLSAVLTGPNEAVLVLNYIKKKTKAAYGFRALTAFGFLLFYTGLMILYARMSERFAWYDVLFSALGLSLAWVMIRNLIAFLQTKVNGPALEVRIKQRVFQVSKDNRLRVERMLLENGFAQKGLADELSEGFAKGDEKGTIDLLMQKFGFPLHESAYLFTLVRKEFRAIYKESAIGFVVVAGITTILSWFVWQFSVLTTGAILTYFFVLMMLVLGFLSFRKMMEVPG